MALDGRRSSGFGFVQRAGDARAKTGCHGSRDIDAEELSSPTPGTRGMARAAKEIRRTRFGPAAISTTKHVTNARWAMSDFGHRISRGIGRSEEVGGERKETRRGRKRRGGAVKEAVSEGTNAAEGVNGKGKEENVVGKEVTRDG